SGDHAIGRNVFAGHAEKRGAMFGKDADLLEAGVVDELGDTFARRELAARVLLVDALFAAALLKGRAFFAQVVELGFDGAWRWLYCFGCHKSCLVGSSGPFGPRHPA